jgi:purine-binding chemotaxis protein CheW
MMEERMTTSINIFEIAGYRYAILLGSIREFVRIPSITPLPKAPRVIEGIINLRGKVIPVLDIRRRFRLPEKAPYPTDYLIVVEVGPRLIGLRVDAICEIQQVDSQDIQSAEGITSGAEYLAGVVKLADGLVLIHDLESFLAEAEARDLDEALLDTQVSAL